MTLRPAVFLDRDGTIIEDRDYLADPGGVRLIPGVKEALRDLADAGLPYVIVTNQSGIARGLFTEDDYRAVDTRLRALLEATGAPAAATRYCPHHPDVTGPCPCRKPGTGMYLDAASSLGLDPRRSYYVGDKITDVLPAHELEGTGILVRTGYGRQEEPLVPPDIHVVDDLRAAVDLILGRR